ncbi:MAG: Uncharacterized protein XD97_0412 [Pelotomaculum thermopropionicum]|uniref:Putative regulatory protein FmdB zinc ribbon domain-containing protein n=1 Tax=Pelotomaculum thermopropionicum TaxID=110500 RepID=A0A117M3L9_9FIRM|nr:MAG: Uncharacterized protein XD97_0412 [Pelotomaculum thermopropionicum]
MPIFEYKCNNCNHVFEILQLPGQNSKLSCAHCDSTDLQKMISAPFLPSSVGKPANDDLKCCGSTPHKDCAGAKECAAPGTCCGQGAPPQAS